ncbi:MAG: hypothetical protein J1F17_06885 [Oscillospiraceae bacterium]|nr:hypothetical protein [Oscillospiraceae bacterium]
MNKELKIVTMNTKTGKTISGLAVDLGYTTKILSLEDATIAEIAEISVKEWHERKAQYEEELKKTGQTKIYHKL